MVLEMPSERNFCSHQTIGSRKNLEELFNHACLHFHTSRRPLSSDRISGEIFGMIHPGIGHPYSLWFTLQFSQSGSSMPIPVSVLLSARLAISTIRYRMNRDIVIARASASCLKSPYVGSSTLKVMFFGFALILPLDYSPPIGGPPE